MNLQDRELELNFREITCKRGVQGDTFAGGVQDFDFSVSGKHAFIPSLSYFVITSKLTVATRSSPIQKNVDPTTGVLNTTTSAKVGSKYRMPYLSDQITYADHFGSCLYNNCFFRAGNSDVSTISQYIPQAAVLKTRLDKSGAWTKYCGRDLSFDDPDFTRRCHKVSLDGTFHEDGLTVQLAQKVRPMLNTAGGSVPYISSTVIPPSALVNNATFTQLSSVLQINPAATDTNPMNALVTAVAPGDIIECYVDAVTANRVFKVINVISATQILVEPINFISGATDGPHPILAVYAPADTRCGFNQIQTVFQPPLGIFSTVNPISGGDFKITLNPNPNFQVAGIQANCTGLVAGIDYKLEIQNVLFYACQIRADVSPTGIIPLSLLEMSVLNKSLSGMGQGSTQNLDFTVPPSTLALTVFVQSTKAGTSNIYPPTQFYSASSTDPNLLQDPYNIVNNIQYIQVTYGSVTKTQTLYSSSYIPPDFSTNKNEIEQTGTNFNIQRWLQSIQYSGKITSDGGAESHPNFLDRGNYWHFDFSRDKNDTSSYVNVQLSFNPVSEVGPTDQLFIVAHYSRQAEIQYENGFITQVVSVNR